MTKASACASLKLRRNEQGSQQSPVDFARADKRRIRRRTNVVRHLGFDRAHKLGYRAVAWPCNDTEAVEKTKACGFREVCTDAPTTIAPLFGRAVNEVQPLNP